MSALTPKADIGGKRRGVRLLALILLASSKFLGS
jgi:hypothetical protein